MALGTSSLLVSDLVILLAVDCMCTQIAVAVVILRADHTCIRFVAAIAVVAAIL